MSSPARFTCAIVRVFQSDRRCASYAACGTLHLAHGLAAPQRLLIRLAITARLAWQLPVSVYVALKRGRMPADAKPDSSPRDTLSTEEVWFSLAPPLFLRRIVPLLRLSVPIAYQWVRSLLFISHGMGAYRSAV